MMFRDNEAHASSQYRWWEQQENDGSVKWTAFVHNGVLFPPPYVPLPKTIKMKYDGESAMSVWAVFS